VKQSKKDCGERDRQEIWLRLKFLAENNQEKGFTDRMVPGAGFQHQYASKSSS
jgi:hypothetical protein